MKLIFAMLMIASTVAFAGSAPRHMGSSWFLNGMAHGAPSNPGSSK